MPFSARDRRFPRLQERIEGRASSCPGDGCRKTPPAQFPLSIAQCDLNCRCTRLLLVLPSEIPITGAVTLRQRSGLARHIRAELTDARDQCPASIAGKLAVCSVAIVRIGGARLVCFQFSWSPQRLGAGPEGMTRSRWINIPRLSLPRWRHLDTAGAARNHPDE